MISIIEKRKETIQISLVLVLIVFSVIYFFYSLVNGNTRDIWSLIGVVGIILIILSEQQGFSVFIAVVLLGTLVAREEFILETSALFRGERLSDLRGSRQVVAGSYEIGQVSETEISERLSNENIDVGALSPEELIQKVEETRRTLTVEKAAITLTDESKQWIRALAESGGLSGNSARYKRLLLIKNNKGYEYLGFLETLGFVKWLSDINVENDFYILTDKGIKLAEKLQVKVKEQVAPPGYS